MKREAGPGMSEFGVGTIPVIPISPPRYFHFKDCKPGLKGTIEDRGENWSAPSTVKSLALVVGVRKGSMEEEIW